MKKEYLPIGSVVILKNATKRVMITGFYVKTDESNNLVYDYVGCLFPEGMVSSTQNCVFNHDQIEKVFHKGLEDDEEKEFKEKLYNLIAEKEGQGE